MDQICKNLLVKLGLDTQVLLQLVVVLVRGVSAVDNGKIATGLRDRKREGQTKTTSTASNDDRPTLERNKVVDGAGEETVWVLRHCRLASLRMTI